MDMDVIYPSGYRPSRHAGGFTLIELLIAVAIASILLGMVAPAFSDLIQSNRQTGHINHLASHLNYARSEAIKRGINIMVCKSQDGMNCTTANEWDQGWILFADNDDDRKHDIAETLLAVQQPLGHDISVSYGAYPSDNYVIYYPTGYSLGNGTFTFCDSRGEDYAKALVLSKPGRLRSARSKPDGSPLECDT